MPLLLKRHPFIRPMRIKRKRKKPRLLTLSRKWLQETNAIERRLSPNYHTSKSPIVFITFGDYDVFSPYYRWLDRLWDERLIGYRLGRMKKD